MLNRAAAFNQPELNRTINCSILQWKSTEAETLYFSRTEAALPVTTAAPESDSVEGMGTLRLALAVAARTSRSLTAHALSEQENDAICRSHGWYP